MKRALLLAVSFAAIVIVVGCASARVGASDTGAPSITIPTHFAEGDTGKNADGGARASGPSTPPQSSAAATAVPSPSAVSPRRDPPDPDPPLKTAVQWEYRLEYAKGTMRVVGIRRVEMNRPVVTARHLGRFAFELWIGAELIDRVRFDFPLLAADLPPEGVRRPLRESPRFAPGADTSQRVMVPDSDRATSAVLVDRLTGSRVPLPWPPVASE